MFCWEKNSDFSYELNEFRKKPEMLYSWFQIKYQSPYSWLKKQKIPLESAEL